MKKLKLSPWHDGSVKPVHVGVYEAKCNVISCDYKTHFSYWNGKRFSGLFRSHFDALRHKNSQYDDSMTKWRGVLK